MNFSNFGNMIFTSVNATITDVNNMAYISKYAKNLTSSFSGSDFTDLSTTANPMAAGLNMTNLNTTYERLMYNGNFLKTSDFGADSFTIYLKHAARFSTLSPFNFQNPNVLKLSESIVFSGSSFTASFYSLLDPGSAVPYLITGCSSADLGGALVSGVFTAPYQSTTYSVAAGVAGRSIKFNVSGGTVVPTLYVPNVVYTVTVSGGVFWLATGGAVAVQQPSITFSTALIYMFDQSHASNSGNTLVLGQIQDSTPYYTTNVVTNSTAGSANAYTLIDLSGQTLPSPALKYFSGNTAGMGQNVNSFEATGLFTTSNVGSTYTVIFTNNASTLETGTLTVYGPNIAFECIGIGGGGRGGENTGGGGGSGFLLSGIFTSGVAHRIFVGQPGTSASSGIGGNTNIYSGINSLAFTRRGLPGSDSFSANPSLGGVSEASSILVSTPYSGTLYNGGNGGSYQGSNGGASFQINGVFYSGGGTAKNGASTYDSSTQYGRGGNGYPRTNGQPGILIITFTL